MIKAVALDFDDTLCLTEEPCFRLENEVLRRMGRMSMERKVHVQTWGMQIQDAIRLRSPGIDVDEFWAAMPAVHQELAETGQIDIVPEENLLALDKIAAMGKLLLVLTGRTRLELTHIMDPKHHLSSRIAKFYGVDDTGHAKPDPRAFDVLLRDNNLRPEEVVYVGDSPGDAASSTGCGMSFIASLESGIRTRDNFADYPVTAFVNAFPEIVPIIAEL